MRDREEIARARRLREALDSLEFEREREAALTRRLEDTIRDAESWRIDEVALARMEAEDADVLWQLGFPTKPPTEEARGRFEARLESLERDLDECRRRQKAYQAYADALSG